MKARAPSVIRLAPHLSALDSFRRAAAVIVVIEPVPPSRGMFWLERRSSSVLIALAEKRNETGAASVFQKADAGPSARESDAKERFRLLAEEQSAAVHDRAAPRRRRGRGRRAGRAAQGLPRVRPAGACVRRRRRPIRLAKQGASRRPRQGAVAESLPHREPSVPGARDRQDRRESDQPLRRRGHEGLRTGRRDTVGEPEAGFEYGTNGLME